MNNTYICTYVLVHNWPLQPFSQDYGLAFKTTYVVCVNFIHEWWGPYSLTSTPNDRFLWNFFMAGLFNFESFCQKSAERKSPKKYFFSFIFSFCCLTGNTNPGFISNKPKHYLQEQGNYLCEKHNRIKSFVLQKQRISILCTCMYVKCVKQTKVLIHKRKKEKKITVLFN